MKAANIVLGICVLGGFLMGAFLNWVLTTSENPSAHTDFLIETSAKCGLFFATMGAAVGGFIWLLTWYCHRHPAQD